MKKFIIRISFVLLGIVILPITYFISKQFSNLTENEEIVQMAFEKQLESVLFSVNVNSENILNSWVNRLDLPVDLNGSIMQEMVTRLFNENASLHQVTFFNLEDKAVIRTFTPKQLVAISIHCPDSVKVTKLKQFFLAGYHRLDAQEVGEKTILFFIPKSSYGTQLCAIVIDTKTFINRNLRSDIQQIAQNNFVISISKKQTGERIFMSNNIPDFRSKTLSQDFLYLPGYTLNIRLVTATIDDLVRERSKRELYLLIGILFVVIIGCIFVIMSIIKEIRLAEIKSDFVSSVSHEIRTPLALISMYAETLLLKRVKNPEKTEEYLKVIHNETNRLSSMVNRILSFSKMEKNKRNYHFSPLNINDSVTDVIETFQPYFHAQNVNCLVNLSPEINEIDADNEAVVEALINVIENAVKYSKDENRKIEISTILLKGNVVVNVEDNGIGISAKHIKYIFDKFYRVTQGDLAHKTKGTGLGLNIVKQIMKKHGGKITVTSKSGEGSCFSLHFPVQQK